MIKIVLVLAMVLFGQPVMGQSPPREIAPSGWQGTWTVRENGRTGSLNIQITRGADGIMGGSISATDAPDFGYGTYKLTDVSFNGKELNFRAVPQKGTLEAGGLRVKDLSRMSGWATHLGYSVWFDLNRTE